jgi:hypothetical protein
LTRKEQVYFLFHEKWAKVHSLFDLFVAADLSSPLHGHSPFIYRDFAYFFKKKNIKKNINQGRKE